MNKKAVIFDMDGVIFDTERVYLDIWSEVFEKNGYTLDSNVYISLMGTGRKNVSKVFVETYGNNLPIEDMYKEKDEKLFEAVNNNLVPMKEGAYELLVYLRENNYKIALATSATRERATKQLNFYNLYNMFNEIVCGNEVTKGKPNPEIYLKAAEKIEVSPENCIVIEDSSAGIKGAYDAKMTPFHVKDLKEADEEIKNNAHKCFANLNEIREYLTNCNIDKKRENSI